MSGDAARTGILKKTRNNRKKAYRCMGCLKTREARHIIVTNVYIRRREVWKVEGHCVRILIVCNIFLW